MEWYFSAIFLIGLVVGLMMLGVPVAIAFLATNVLGILVYGGAAGLPQIVENSTDLVATYTLAPVPLFVLMGSLIFHVGLAHRVFDALDKLLGRIPGRLCYLTVGGGTLFSTLTGSTLANAAMLGSLMVPEMQRRGYNARMSMGPILGTGGLAMIIPPSALAVLFASIANIDVGKLLVAGIVPGFILAALYIGMITLQLRLDPEGAPAYEVTATSWRDKLAAFVINILPMGLVVFMVIGFIVLGIATPTESAAFGVIGVFILGALFRGLTWASMLAAMRATIRVSGMVFFIIMGSTVFSSLLAYSGASAGMLRWATGFEMPPLVVLAIMFVVLLFIGMFMDQVSTMLITIPIFFPLAESMGFDLIWFALVMLISLEMSLTTPPFGLLLFIMLGIAPQGTRLMQIFSAAAPYLLCDAVLVALLVVAPSIALYLPGLMD
jgi:tripartite ATP-independent transporter DctM subunit